MSSPPILITPRLLRAWPLPHPGEGGDKETRGRVLVVGGCPEMPGAVILAAEAALRAGAGKLEIAAPASIAALVAQAVPESLVRALEQTPSGGLAPANAALLADRIRASHAAVLGPGILDEAALTALLHAVLPRLTDSDAALVLDAAALSGLSENKDALRALAGRVVLTPHAGEMAGMLGLDKREIEQNPLEMARQTAKEWQVVVALKGRETFIAAPDGQAYCNKDGNVGLATSGSGDTLAGMVGGLAARGAEPLHAAVWGVTLHARAGDALARKTGPLGFLARELLAEIPSLMHALDAPAKTRQSKKKRD